MATSVPNAIHRQEDWFLYIAGQGTLPDGGAQNRLEEWYMWLAANVVSGGLITTTATLAAGDWANSEQTVSVSDATASNTVFISPAPSSIDSYHGASVYCSAQGDGTLTFACGATAPSVDITVNILIVR